MYTQRKKAFHSHLQDASRNGLGISAMNVLTICAVYTLIGHTDSRTVTDSYLTQRNHLLQEERLLSLGGNITLTSDEQEANDVLMQWKRKEIEESFHNSQRLNFTKHYFTYMDHMESSKVYQIIRKMPKGASLHVHSSFMLDADGLLELTYEDNLYSCYDTNLKLLFSDTVPTQPCPVEWTLLSELRGQSENVMLFDEELKKHFSLVTNNEETMDGDINSIWEQFEGIHQTTKPFLSYRPVREKYIYKVLEKYYNDNIMYIEIRMGLSIIFELNGTKYDPLYDARLYRDITKKFIEDHPDFIGIKIIVCAYRAATPEKVLERLELAKKMQEEMPEIFAGFDLVGQEDKGRPLIDFVPMLKENQGVDFYFHAGETGWFGSSTDENLVDAILLGSKRIGHAYSLLKHPNLIKLVVEKDIAIEVNVISNAVLSLLRDVRNHPLATFLASGIPVVLSSDDPSAWGAEPLSHDFYIAFVAVASQKYDIRMLKQLAINSIKYSALDRKGKEVFMSVFEDRWNRFVGELKSTGTQDLRRYTMA